MSEEIPPEKDMIVHGDVCIKKERNKRRKLILWDLLYEFSRSTTLHGLRYITEQGLSIVEKIFWFITFMTSMCICFYFIYNVYEKWQSTPVIVTISESLVPVANIPFPSVTICPQTKCKYSVHNYTIYHAEMGREFAKRIFNKNWTPPEWVIKQMDVTTVCQNDLKLEYFVKLILSINEESRNSSLIHNLEEVVEPFDYIFYKCRWRSFMGHNSRNCKYYFKKVLTQEGVCFNFNSLAASEIFQLDNIQTNYSYLEAGNESLINGWHPYFGYLNENKDVYPRRGKVNGATPDLDVIMRRNVTEKGELCNTLFNGYKIYIHHPGDHPQSSLYYAAALDGQLTSLAVKCNIVNTSSKLLDKSPEERKCYFEGESNLTYFKRYTAKNCMLECLSKYTFQKCGCVAFYMPHNDSNHICHIGYDKCMSDAVDELADIEASRNISQGKTIQKCNCLPSCYTVDYNAEILKTSFDIKTVNKNYDTKNENDIQYSRITVFFQQPEFVSMRRSELFGKTDFVANCGGLLGLFLGFSVLSIVEVIYFATLRLWSTLRRDSKQEKRK